MNIFMFTDDYSFEGSLLEQVQSNVACVSWCTNLLPHRTSLLISCVLTSLSTLSYQTIPMFGNFITVNLQPVLDCNMSSSRLKHPESESDETKPVWEKISFL